MPGWPDWQKTTAWTFPPDLSGLTITTNVVSVTGDTTATIASFTDGLLHILYATSLVGSITNTDTANDKSPIFRVNLTRGVDNGGAVVSVLGGTWHVPAAIAGQLQPTVGVTLVLNQPILFRAGSVGTPNLLQLQSSGGVAAFKASLAWNVIQWAVS